MHLPHVTPFSDQPLYFLTACAAGRRPMFARQEVHEALVRIWHNSAEHDGWFVGRFMIMPDHVHFFAMPNRGAKDRATWCKVWKSVSSRQITRATKEPPPIWQPDTFDHILRSGESYSKKWDYVRANPVRAGLVENIADWPWQGEIHSLAF